MSGCLTTLGTTGAAVPPAWMGSPEPFSSLVLVTGVGVFTELEPSSAHLLPFLPPWTPFQKELDIHCAYQLLTLHRKTCGHRPAICSRPTLRLLLMCLVLHCAGFSCMCIFDNCRSDLSPPPTQLLNLFTIPSSAPDVPE
jgi:hypothetical protein